MLQRLFFLLALALPVTASAQTDKSPQPEQQPSPSAETTAPKPTHPLLDQLFKDGLNPDQMKALGEHSTLKDQAAAMTPDQKTKVRQGLDEAKTKAKTPMDFQEIAEGYLILDEHEENKGQNAHNAARQLIELDPKNPAGWKIEAQAQYQMGNLQAAAENAKESLRLNPSDKNAFSVYMLSTRGTTGKKIDPKAIEQAFSTQNRGDLGMGGERLARQRDDDTRPIEPVFKGAAVDSIVVPALTTAKSHSPAPLPEGSPLFPMAGLGLGLAGYGVYRSKKTWESEDGLASPGRVENEKDPLPGVERAKQYLCEAKGSAEKALERAQTERRKLTPEEESLTPEGAERRNAENYLTAYWAVDKGQILTPKLTYLSYVSIGIPLWQGWHVARGAAISSARALGLSTKIDTDPPSFQAMAAGYEGANDAVTGAVHCAQ